MDFWTHNGFLDSRWISRFTMDFWIHDESWYQDHGTRINQMFGVRYLAEMILDFGLVLGSLVKVKS